MEWQTVYTLIVLFLLGSKLFAYAIFFQIFSVRNDRTLYVNQDQTPKNDSQKRDWMFGFLLYFSNRSQWSGNFKDFFQKSELFQPELDKLNTLIPPDPYRFLCKQFRSWWDGSSRAVSSGSSLFAILLLILTEIPICNNECVQIQRWKSPCRKIGDERVKQIILTFKWPTKTGEKKMEVFLKTLSFL